MGSDPQYAKYPLLPLAQHIFTLTNPAASKSTQQTSVKSLQDAITEHKMAPFYRYLAHPSEGILNATGVSTSRTEKPLGRKPSATGLVASKTSIPKVDLPWDESLYERLKKENDEELEGFKKEEEEAAEKAGDTEVQAARGKRAEFWARVGDKVLAFITAIIRVELTMWCTGPGNCCIRGGVRKDGRFGDED
jgi:26S proteasome regulatory subunit N7